MSLVVGYFSGLGLICAGGTSVDSPENPGTATEQRDSAATREEPSGSGGTTTEHSLDAAAGQQTPNGRSQDGESKTDPEMKALAEDDLAAQRDMAWAAVIMLGIAGIQLIVSGFALYFLWKTLKATSDATKAAQRSADAAIQAVHSDRAWMCFEKYEIDFLPSEGFFAAHCVLKWINTGKTPALNARCTVGHQWNGIPSFTPGFQSDAGAVLGQGLSIDTQPIRLTAAEVAQIVNKQATLYIYSAVEYQTVYETVAHPEECCFRLEIDLPPGEKIAQRHIRLVTCSPRHSAA